ncbi:MAG: hypothetical protein ACOYM3_16870 [Terrimicrobiaceae bacterium]
MADFAEFVMMNGTALPDCGALQGACNGETSASAVLSLRNPSTPIFWHFERKKDAADLDGAAAREKKPVCRWRLSSPPREEKNRLGFVGPTAGGEIFMVV